MKKFKYFNGFVNDVPTHTPQTGEIGYIQPMMENRFLVEFPESLNIPTNTLRLTSRPSCRFINQMIQWDDMEFIFYDLVNPSISQSLFSLINDQELNRNLVVKIKRLNGIGEILCEWSIFGFLSEINFGGNLDYASEDVSNVSIRMCVHHAVLN